MNLINFFYIIIILIIIISIIYLYLIFKSNIISSYIINKTNKILYNSDLVTENHNYIPKILFTTYYKKSKIPQKVFDNIKKYSNNYTHIIFDDQQGYDFY